MGYSEQEILTQPNLLDYNLVFDEKVGDRTSVAKELMGIKNAHLISSKRICFICKKGLGIGLEED